MIASRSFFAYRTCTGDRPYSSMRKLLVFVAAVAACAEATAPRQFTLGPGCTKMKEVIITTDRGETVVMRVTTYDRDCTVLNLDSLLADGWVVAWDTT